jgi:hypothetical protein
MSSRLHRAHRARMTECVDAIATAISVASDASAWGRVVSGAVDEHSGHVYTSRFRSGPVVSCREQRAAEPGVSDDRQFGGTVIRMVIEHCRDHVAGVSVDRLLSLANERRSLSVLVDDASWSSYGQVCAVLEAAAQLLSGAEKLAAIGERAAIARSRRYRAVASMSDSTAERALRQRTGSPPRPAPDRTGRRGTPDSTCRRHQQCALNVSYGSTASPPPGWISKCRWLAGESPV